MMDEREQRGMNIARQENQVKRINENKYEVSSQSNHGIYEVLKTSIGWMCQCPDHVYRGVKCKHIFAVEFSSQLRKVVQIRRVEPEADVQTCRFCGSNHIVHAGMRHNKSGDLQKYLCRSCGHYFTINLGFERMRATPQIITSAMQLYFTGESLRNVQKFLKLQGVKISHVAILKWIRKYVALMNDYLEKIKPNVSDTWRADELYVKIKGDMKYLFALMDDETRFWIAQEIADTKYTHDARTLFQAGVKVAGKKPMTLITDGLAVYHLAYMKEFWTKKKETRTEHIRHITIRGDHNNNKMERMNGEVRDREKVMRGLKKNDTPILKGYQLFHNYIRPHEGLNGKTPAEACGIKIEGENKWLTLIQNASKPTNQP
jgi:transposase-like protein/DNA-directed RNA polymerase subunit M/transcription elongation factor TFIIS